MPVFRSEKLLTTLLAICLVTAVLYLAKEFLLPFALATLIAFLLTPVVCRLQAWGVPAIPSVIIVAIVAFGIIAGGFYVVAVQVADLTKSLPSYQENFHMKVVEPLGKLSAGFSKIEHELEDPASTGSERVARENPVRVEVVSSRMSVLSVAKDLIRPIVAPLGKAAIVIVMVLFLLMQRQDLRDRFIHIVGRGRLNVTTQAIDDAANRVSRYLGAQLIVNITYGVPIGIGLYFIGIPNAALWGVLAIGLRFIPYLGPWIAASLPLLLSLAVSPGWTQPIATAALFIVVELICNNAVEPWLYGSSTGLSPTAVVVSAVFWTWLWGLGGLLLATPLTVCLAVLGKHVPQLSVLDILLGDNPPIAPEHRFYQRLLAGDEAELYEIISEYDDRKALAQLFDGVILPALHLAELDLANGSLTTAEQVELHTNLRDALASIDGFRFEWDEPNGNIVIVPMRSEGDLLAGAMLAHLLRMRGLGCAQLSPRQLASEVKRSLEDNSDALVCASTLTLTGARIGSSLLKRLDTRVKLLGYWLGDADQTITKIPAPDMERVTNLDEAVRHICAKCKAPLIEPEPAASAA